jgi:hypothetical protein
MTGLGKAPRQTPPPKPEAETRSYIVLSRRCVWGRKGETIELALGDREQALLAAGTLALAPEPETDRPLKSADKEG